MTILKREQDIYLSNSGEVFSTKEECLKEDKRLRKANIFSVIIFIGFIIITHKQLLELF